MNQSSHPLETLVDRWRGGGGHVAILGWVYSSWWRAWESWLRRHGDGGGVADVMEVNCLERPCGDIRVAFAVVDGQGEVIDRIEEIRKGRQGERLQIVLESQNPEARSIVLQSFSAKARLD